MRCVHGVYTGMYACLPVYSCFYTVITPFLHCFTPVYAWFTPVSVFYLSFRVLSLFVFYLFRFTFHMFYVFYVLRVLPGKTARTDKDTVPKSVVALKHRYTPLPTVTPFPCYTVSMLHRFHSFERHVGKKAVKHRSLLARLR